MGIVHSYNNYAPEDEDILYEELLNQKKRSKLFSCSTELDLMN